MPALLTDDEVTEALNHMPQWRREGNAITRAYRFRSFREAIEFVNRVADEAEAADHHPDIDIRYDKVTMTLSTHSAGGLTAKDTHLAHQIEAAAKPNL